MTYPIFCVTIFRYADTLGLDYWPGKDHHDHMVRIVKKRPCQADKTLGIIQLAKDNRHMIVWSPNMKKCKAVQTVEQAFDLLIRYADE